MKGDGETVKGNGEGFAAQVELRPPVLGIPFSRAVGGRLPEWAVGEPGAEQALDQWG